jgi:tetratricopeptide (TPR) repeat protein
MTGRRDLFDESMRLGHAAHWEKEWDHAIGYYRKALAEFPDEPGALTSLGLALLETGQLKEALPIYRRAAKINPQDPVPVEKCAEVFERLGQNKDAIDQRMLAAEMHIRLKDADKAIDNWIHVARIQPSDLKVRSRLALAYERMGRRREAVYEYMAVAAILQQATKRQAAIESVQRALSLVPGDPEATRALRLLSQGRDLPPPSQPKAATRPLDPNMVRHLVERDDDEALEKTEGADPEIIAQRQALSVLAGMLFDEPGDGDEADSPGMTALARGKLRGARGSARPQTYRYLGQAIDLQTQGRTAQAAKELQRAVEAGLDHPAAHYNLGLLLRESGDLQGAHKELVAAVGHPGLDLGANLALGRLAKEQGNLPEAARFLMQAMRLADAMSVGQGQSSQLNEIYDSFQASLAEGDAEALSKIIESSLKFLSGPEWLSRLKHARRRLTEQTGDSRVVPIAEMLVGGGTEAVFQSLERIDKLAQSGHLASAMEEALLALQTAPSYLALHSRMAEILIMGGHVEAGMDKLSVIAQTHIVRGESAQAATVYGRMISLSPVDIEARKQLIQLYVQQDRVSDALKQHLELAELYRQMAQIDEARQTLAEAQELAQQYPADRELTLEVLRQLGEISLSRLDWRNALQAFEEIGRLDPSDENARSQAIDLKLRLGQEEQAGAAIDSYLDFLVKSHRGGKALEILEDLAREHPGKQALHTRLAEAYRAAGRKADAIAQYDALGEIQLDAGRVDEAIQTIQTIIDLEPPDVEGYEELIRNLRAEQ